MCGIAGIAWIDAGRAAGAGDIEPMVAALRHRGPDGVGYHCEPGIALGHARLGIIDLDGGAQPIRNEDGSVWITYNGEIFNYVELRRELEQRGHVFYTQTDTEVIVHLYEERGERFVEALNGQFALALWDRNARKLVLARDRAGILPLYYAETRDGLLFGSEIKALLATRRIAAALDPEGLDDVMTFWAPLAPRTAFRGVGQLRPGELMVVQGAERRRHRYWDWRFPPRGAHRTAADLLERELTELLVDATAIRLRADVPVGAYLSGGLDSSSLVALLAERVPETLRTFSIGFDEPELDETPFQRLLVSRLGTAHEHLRCSRGDVARAFPKTIRHAETPVLRAAPVAMGLLSALVRGSDVKVVLTGEGADEVLGGYDIFKEAKARRFWAQRPDSRWRPALLKRLYPYLDLASTQSTAYLKEFFAVGLDSPDDPCFSHLPRFAMTAQCKLFWSDELRAQVAGTAVERLHAELPAELGGWHPFNRGEYLEARTLLPGYLLSSQGDRMLMASSVEGRFPFLDHRLIELANEIHPRHKMRALGEKHLLKRAMRTRVPPEILARHKQPYRAPDAAAFIGPDAPEYVGELMSKKSLAATGYFDPDKVGFLVAKLRRARVPAARDSMAYVGVLSTQVLHAELIAGRAVE